MPPTRPRVRPPAAARPVVRPGSRARVALAVAVLGFPVPAQGSPPAAQGSPAAAQDSPPGSGGSATPALPRLVVRADDTLVTESCELAFEGPVRDANGDGVVHVRGKHLVVRMAPGQALRGAPEGTPWDRLDGMGIVAEDCPGLRLEGLRVHGFKVGVLVRRCEDLVAADLDLSDNFRQRLGSTAAREDPADWLSPHDNDAHEWRTRYGAALCIEESEDPVVRRVRVRRGQNGIVLDRVTGARVYDNDCSFLSGWGLALWRSSKNLISRNAFDFCVRGYSHGVYNRGQDSAGILMFEQCRENTIVENSCTHGGDGFFGFSGKEALGQKKHPNWMFPYKMQGNRRNKFLRNEFSYAAAHGLEQTFAYGESIESNRFVGNAICGIWGGYSNHMWIDHNHFERNGDAGYGLERGGVNIEHGAHNHIHENRFVANTCGVHLWEDDDPGILATPWAKANHEGCFANEINLNRFEKDKVAIHLRRARKTETTGNVFSEVGTEVKLEDGSDNWEDVTGILAGRLKLDDIPGDTHPVGARKQLEGRENIVVGEWGPWDHEAPFLRPLGETSRGVAWELWGVTEAPAVEFARPGKPEGLGVEQHRDGAHWRLELWAERPGPLAFACTWSGGGAAFPLAGLLLGCRFEVRVFAWKTDPREDHAAWLREARGAPKAELPRLSLRYGSKGPAALGHWDAEAVAGIGNDRFGTLAETRVPLPKGSWLLRTTSDDGIRVRVDGKPVIEDWTWHAPKQHVARLELDRERTVHIEVEHFELDGWSVLELELVPAK